MRIIVLTLLLFILSISPLRPALSQVVSATNPTCLSGEVVPSGTSIPSQYNVTNNCTYSVAFYWCNYPIDTSESTCPTQYIGIAGKQTTTKSIITTESNQVAIEECPVGYTVTSTISISLPIHTLLSCQAVLTSHIESAILPSAVAVELGDTASAFATVIGTEALSNCVIAVSQTNPAPFAQFSFQEMGSSAAPNTPFNLSPNVPETFTLRFSGSEAGSFLNQQIVYSCAQEIPALSIPGLSSLDVYFPPNPTANIVASIATPSNNGVFTVPVGQSSAFAVATDNTGNAAATLTVEADTNGVKLPLKLTLCQTNPKTAACLATPATSLSATFAEGVGPTFSVFATATGTINLSPTTTRVFIRFKYNNIEIGASSVAVNS